MNGLAVHESGPIGAPALVFLHGVGTDASMWTREIALLTDYHCLAPDLPGHGRSADLSWTSLADVAGQVADVIAAKTADGRACVVGLSLGGAVGYVLLARYPAVVSRAVIEGAVIVTSRLAPLVTTGVRLASPFLHRAVVIRGLGQAVGVPTRDMPSFGKGIRGVRPRAFRRAFAQAQNPGYSTRSCRARFPRCWSPDSARWATCMRRTPPWPHTCPRLGRAGRPWTRPWVDSYSPGPAQSDG